MYYIINVSRPLWLKPTVWLAHPREVSFAFVLAHVWHPASSRCLVGGGLGSLLASSSRRLASRRLAAGLFVEARSVHLLAASSGGCSLRGGALRALAGGHSLRGGAPSWLCCTMSSSEEDVHDAALAAMGGTSDDEDAPDHDAALDALAAAGDRPYNLSHLKLKL